MRFIKNTADGCCASIVFYQFVKQCVGIPYDDIYHLVHVSLPKSETVFLNLISPIIKRYYNLIRSSKIEPLDLPNGKHSRPFPRSLDHLTSSLGEFGTSEYGFICLFCRYLCVSWSGVWVGDYLGGRSFYSSTSKTNKSSNMSYVSFMLNHGLSISNIPRVCYLVWADADGIVEDGFHVMLLIGRMLYDSNACRPAHLSIIDPIYKAVE